MIRHHLRSNVVGYLALFVALSGTAVALPATDTVFGDDIVDGQIESIDISDIDGVRSVDVRDDDKNGGGLAAIDLARDSVGSSEIATDGVGSPEIATDAVRGPEIATDGVGSPEIETDAVRGPEIATDAVGSPEIELDAVRAPEIATDGVGSAEIAEDAVGASEIGTDTVGKDAIGIDEVGANELDEVHEHESEEVTVEDGTAHDGAYGIGAVRVACLFDDEDLLSVSIDWIDTNEHAERMLADVEIDRGLHADEADAAIVRGAFDGGGGSANPARFVAYATCLQS
jgi:hypothetical protein